MMYSLEFTDIAEKDIIALKRSDTQAYKKIEKLLIELMEHPTTGTGKPKPLGEDRLGQWSRRISQKHRLVYEIYEKRVTVLILSAHGHYGDK